MQYELITVICKLHGDYIAEKMIQHLKIVKDFFLNIIVLEDSISRAQIKLTDVADTLQGDWVILAQQLDITGAEINQIKSDYHTVNDQALAMLQLWVSKKGEEATGRCNNVSRNSFKCLWKLKDDNKPWVDLIIKVSAKLKVCIKSVKGSCIR